jgi:hypothetical protein
MFIIPPYFPRYGPKLSDLAAKVKRLYWLSRLIHIHKRDIITGALNMVKKIAVIKERYSEKKRELNRHYNNLEGKLWAREC